jgi:hypothetical protein
MMGDRESAPILVRSRDFVASVALIICRESRNVLNVGDMIAESVHRPEKTIQRGMKAIPGGVKEQTLEDELYGEACALS